MVRFLLTNNILHDGNIQLLLNDDNQIVIAYLHHFYPFLKIRLKALPGYGSLMLPVTLSYASTKFGDLEWR